MARTVVAAEKRCHSGCSSCNQNVIGTRQA